LIRSIFYYIRSNLGNAILLYVLWGFIIEAFCLLCTCMRSLLGFCQGSVAWSFVASCWISSSLCDLSLRLDQLLLVELHGASCCIRLGTRRLISKPKDLSCVYPPFGVSVKTGFWLFWGGFCESCCFYHTWSGDQCCIVRIPCSGLRSVEHGMAGERSPHRLACAAPSCTAQVLVCKLRFGGTAVSTLSDVIAPHDWLCARCCWGEGSSAMLCETDQVCCRAGLQCCSVIFVKFDGNFMLYLILFSMMILFKPESQVWSYHILPSCLLFWLV